VCTVSKTDVAGELDKAKFTLRQTSKPANTVIYLVLVSQPSLLSILDL